jgi:hypothetical protein
MVIGGLLIAAILAGNALRAAQGGRLRIKRAGSRKEVTLKSQLDSAVQAKIET